jgi:hypothetical protein
MSDWAAPEPLNAAGTIECDLHWMNVLAAVNAISAQMRLTPK